jgi:hypothetical protein
MILPCGCIPKEPPSGRTRCREWHRWDEPLKATNDALQAAPFRSREAKELAQTRWRLLAVRTAHLDRQEATA